MCCPLKEYKDKKWVCRIAIQDCPEAKLVKFDYKSCSTYIEFEEEVYEYNWMD